MTKPRSIRPRGAIAVLVVLVLVAAGCGSGSGTSSGSSQPPGTSSANATLRVVRTEGIDGWVLDSAATYASYQTDAAVFEGLLRIKPDGSGTAAGLADTWSFDPASTSWTFHIRDNAAFSDGKPVTSADVVFSEKIWSAGKNFGSSYARITSVDAPDPHTVVFHLSKPDNNFEALLSASVSGVMPNNFGGQTEQNYYANPIGAGAYKIDKWSAGARIELSRNEHFYNSADGGPAKLNIDVVTDENERSILFQSGDAQIVEYVPAPAVKLYSDSDLAKLPVSQVLHLSMNVASGPFSDTKVRTAVANAVDDQQIIDGAYAGNAEKPSGILPPNLPGWAPPSKNYFTTDLDKAKALLAASSGAGGFKTEVIYDAGVASDALAAQIIKANLAPLGIDVTTTGLETAAFLDRAFGTAAPMVLWTFGAVSPDIADPVNWISGTGWLFSGFDTAALIDLSTAYSVAPANSDEAKAAITRIQDQAITDVPAVALAHFSVQHALASSVHGTFAPWGLYYYDELAIDG